MKFYQYILISVILFKILLATNDDLEVNNKISYLKYFKEKRIQHQNAVKQIFDLKNGKKQMEMLKPVVNKIFEVLFSTLEKLAKIQNSNRDPESIEKDNQIANDISILLENTAFTADLALHFPKIFHKLYDKNKNWQMVLESSVHIAKNSNILDEQTIQAINLMSQELKISPRSADYQNPYSKQQQVAEEPVVEVPKKKKKEKKPRGPGLSGGIKYDL